MFEILETPKMYQIVFENVQNIGVPINQFHQNFESDVYSHVILIHLK